MREVQGQMVSFKLELEEGDSLVREKEIQVEKKKEEGNKMKVQWNRKKKGKEEEILCGSNELEHAKKHLGQEELAVVELSGQMVSFKLELEEGDSLVREKEIQVEKKKEEGNKMKVQWNRKKKGKEEEISSRSFELEHAKKHLGQEELAVV